MTDTVDFIRQEVQRYAGGDDGQLLAAIKNVAGERQDEVCDLQLIAADILFRTANGNQV